MRGTGFYFSHTLVPTMMAGELAPKFNISQDKYLHDNTGGTTRKAREHYLFNKFVKDSAFIAHCDEGGVARVYFEGRELFRIFDNCYVVVDELSDTDWHDEVSNLSMNKLNKHLNLKLTLKRCSEIAHSSVTQVFHKRDGRTRGLRYKEILYINSLMLGWNIPSTHSEVSSVMRERCTATWVYHNIIERYYLSRESLMHGDIIESDLVNLKYRANMFYITEQGNKIGYWRLNKVISQIFYHNKLENATFSDIYNGRTSFLFEEEIRTKHALKCKASVLIYKNFTETFVRDNIACHEIEMFYHAFCIEDNSGDFSIVQGDDIARWYNQEKYYEIENGSPLAESCMRYEECGDNFHIYAKNKACKMLIYKHKTLGTIMGRALLWEATDGTNTYNVMDRIYYCYERILPQFTKWAVDNNYIRKKRQCYDSWVFVKTDGTEIDDSSYMYIQLEKWDFGYYPYMDTFYVLDMDDGRLCLENSGFEARHLRCTGGGYEDDGEYTYLEYCDLRVHIDEACWSEYHNCYIHPDDCFHSEWEESYIFNDQSTHCEDIGEGVHEDHAVHSEHDDCYYTEGSTVYSEFYDSEILKDNAKLCCGGDYAYEDDCEYIDGTYYIIDSDEHEQILIDKEACGELYEVNNIYREIDNTIDKSIGNLEA